MTLEMSVTFVLATLIASMASTARPTTLPPCSAWCLAPEVSELASTACSALARIVLVSSSMLLAVSCRALACARMRSAMCALLLAMSPAPLSTSTAAPWILLTVSVSCEIVALRSSVRRSNLPW